MRNKHTHHIYNIQSTHNTENCIPHQNLPHLISFLHIIYIASHFRLPHYFVSLSQLPVQHRYRWNTISCARITDFHIYTFKKKRMKCLSSEPLDIWKRTRHLLHQFKKRMRSFVRFFFLCVESTNYTISTWRERKKERKKIKFE